MSKKKKLLVRAANRNEFDGLGDYLIESLTPAAEQLGVEVVRVPYMEYYKDVFACKEKGGEHLKEQLDYHIRIAANKEVQFANKFSDDECIGFLFFTDWSLVGYRRVAADYMGIRPPVIFWSREDPNHFGSFLSDGLFADVICTSAEECVTKYQQHYPASRVLCTPMAVAPEIYYSDFTPVNFWKREFDIVFVGNRYADREVRTSGENAVVFAAVDWARRNGRKFGVYGLHKGPHSWEGVFPVWHDLNGNTPFLDEKHEKLNPEYQGIFQGRCTGRLETADVYRNTKVALSVASNENSLTMVPNRVVQIGVSSILIAYRSKATERLTGGHALISDTAEKTWQYLDDIFFNVGNFGPSEEYIKRAERARDFVLSAHTFRHRLEAIVDVLEDLKKRKG